MGVNKCLKMPISAFKLGAETGDVKNLSGRGYERIAFAHSK